MRLTDLKASGFRSLAQVGVEGCGKFNVLIGKNNSGKSNILGAIDLFFKIVQQDSLAGHHRGMGREIEYHDRDTSLPIELAASFNFDSDEMEVLKSEIRDEYPQLQNALAGIEEYTVLQVGVTLTHGPTPLACIRGMSLVRPTPSNAGAFDRKILLNLTDEAAEEIAGRARKAADLVRDVRAIERFLERVDVSEWSALRERMTATRGASTARLRYYAGPDLNPDTDQKLRRVITQAASFAEYQQHTRDLLLSINEQLDGTSDVLPIANSFEDFAGKSNEIPAYVRNLQKRIAGTKILHLADRREPIGAVEATRILELKNR